MLSKQESAIESYLLSESNHLFCFCNTDFTILNANNLFANTLDLNSSDIIGKNLSTILSEKHPSFQTLIKESVAENNPQQFIFNIPNADGLQPIIWDIKTDGQIIAIKGTKTQAINKNEQSKLVAIADSLSDCIFVLDQNFDLLFRNKAAITKFNHPQFKNNVNSFFGSFSEETNIRFTEHFKAALEGAKPLRFVEFSLLLNTWFCIEVIPYNNELNVIATDISDRIVEHKTNELELKTFEMNIEKTYSMSEILMFLLKGFESLYPHLHTSILKIEDGKVYHACSPNLPEEFNQSLNGERIGDQKGSCGTAAFSKKPNISTDISTDPNWKNFNQILAENNYKSCWSFPIISNKNLEVMATFAAYSKENKKPTDAETKTIARICNVVKILLEDEKHDNELLLINNRYKTVTKATNDAIYDWDLKSQTVYWSDNIYNIFGFTAKEVEQIKNWWKTSIHPDDLDITIKRLKSCLREKKSGWTAEYRLKCKNGLYKYVYDRAYIIYNAKNEPITIIGAVQDISVLKEREIEILKQNNKLKEIAQISSHDLRRPVTSILGLTNLFNNDNLSDENNKIVIDYLQKATSELDQVIHTIVAKTLDADHTIYNKHTKIRS